MTPDNLPLTEEEEQEWNALEQRTMKGTTPMKTLQEVINQTILEDHPKESTMQPHFCKAERTWLDFSGVCSWCNKTEEEGREEMNPPAAPHSTKPAEFPSVLPQLAIVEAEQYIQDMNKSELAICTIRKAFEMGFRKGYLTRHNQG